MRAMFAVIVLWSGLVFGQAPDVKGTWSGALETPGGTLRLAVHFDLTTAGALTGKLDSLDQGAMGLPLDEVTVEGDKVRFLLKVVGGSYEGTLNGSKDTLTGVWRQGSELPLVFKRSEGPIAAPSRPQLPKPPFPYTPLEVAFPNKKAGITLDGTLTLPQGKGPFPVAVLITGSGPQDRDESLMGHKPFLVLADHLTRNGVAVLRYDDRGFGKSSGSFAQSTSRDFADDVSSAIDFLMARPEVDRKRIGLIGHSEGGLIAPIVATERNEVAWVILLAGTAVPLEQVLYAQGEAILKSNGAGPEALEKQRSTQESMFAVMKQEKDPEVINTKLKGILGDGPQAKAQIGRFNTPWFRWILFYDPAPALERVKVPLLAMNGELDKQVLVDQNLTVIDAAMKRSGNKQYTSKRMPGLNHLFQAAKTGAPQEYSQIEETMSPVALETISGWLRTVNGFSR